LSKLFVLNNSVYIGLCGNFNDDPTDDFMIYGSQNLTDDVNVFAESYQTNLT